MKSRTHAKVRYLKKILNKVKLSNLMAKIKAQSSKIRIFRTEKKYHKLCFEAKALRNQKWRMFT
jgi:hypothetical protein